MSERVLALMSASLEAHKGLQQDVGTLEDLTPAFESVELHEYDVASVESIYISLGRIADSIQTSMESDTLTDATLDMAKIAVESNAAQLGVGLENVATFAGTDSASVTVESLGDTLKKIWDTIKTAIQRAIKAVKDFFSKLLGGVGKLTKKFEELLTAAKKADDVANTNITLSTASYLSYNKEVSVANILEGLSSQKKLGETLLNDWVDEAINYCKMVVDVNIDKDFLQATETTESEALADLVNTKVFNRTKFDQLVTSLIDGRLLGDFIAAMDKRAFHFSRKEITMLAFKRREEELNHNQSVEISTPTKYELIVILEEALAITKLIEGQKSAIEKMAKGREDVTKSFDKFIDASDRGKVGTFWTKARSRNYLSIANIGWGGPVRQYCNYSYSSLRAIVDLAEKSLKA